MSSLAAISFVMIATLLGKWLLFDDDRPQAMADDAMDLKVVDAPPETRTTTTSQPPYSKSA